jgi:predicted ATP-grasp superfamily ATP-dependent carboligase
VHHNSPLPPALILGEGLNALAVARSLGRRGVSVMAIEPGRHSLSSESRYLKVIPFPHTGNRGEELLNVVHRVSDQVGLPLVLIPTGDRDVRFLSHYRHRFPSRCKLVIASHEVVETCLDKWAFAQWTEREGFPVPKTSQPNSIAEVKALSRDIRYPCLYKPSYSPDWEHPDFSSVHGRVKMIRVDSPSELVQTYEALGRFRQGVLVQEMIEGPETALVDLYACYSDKGSPRSLFAIRKQRTFPLDGRGPGASVRSHDSSTVRALGVAVLDRLRYQGPGAVCFKFLPSGDEVRIVEVNARLPLHHGLASFCGIDLAWIAYCEAVGITVETSDTWPADVLWLSTRADLRAAYSYWRRGDLTLGGWLRSLTGPRVFGDWAADDPRPFLSELKGIARDAARRLHRGT